MQTRVNYMSLILYICNEVTHNVTNSLETAIKVCLEFDIRSTYTYIVQYIDDIRTCMYVSSS